MAAMDLQTAQDIESYEDVSVCTYQCEDTKCKKPHPSTATIEVVDEFLCGICHDVMINPVSCSEGHAWCKTCIMDWLSKDGTCPVDRQPLSDSSLTKNRLIENMIAKLDVSCYLKREGCNWIGNRRIYQLHADSCPFTPASCHYCKAITTCNRIDKHMEVCDQAPVECSLPYCEWIGERRKLQDHSAACDFRSLPCEYCKGSIVVKDLEEHKKVCESAPVTCSYASIGCNWTGERRLQEEHVSSCNLRPVLYREDGSLEYEGELKEDEYGRHVKHGRGKLFNQHGMEYDGEWKDNRRHGHGVSYRDDGAIEYEGQWQNGFKHGQGVLLNEDDVAVYDGQWKHNRKHGRGLSCSDDGKKEYEGEWQNNKRHGYGSVYQHMSKQPEQFWLVGKLALVPPRVLAPPVGSVTLENAEAYFQLAMQNANLELAAALHQYYTQTVARNKLVADLNQAKADARLINNLGVDYYLRPCSAQQEIKKRLSTCRQLKEKLDGFPEPKAPSVAGLSSASSSGGAATAESDTPNKLVETALKQSVEKDDYSNMAQIAEAADWSNIYAGLVEAFTEYYKQPFEKVDMNQCLQFKTAIDLFPKKVPSLRELEAYMKGHQAALVGVDIALNTISEEQTSSFIEKYPSLFQAFIKTTGASDRFKIAHCSSCLHRFCSIVYSYQGQQTKCGQRFQAHPRAESVIVCCKCNRFGTFGSKNW